MCSALTWGALYSGGGGAPTLVTVLQDFIALPPDFVERTLAFYSLAGDGSTLPVAAAPAELRASLLSYPRRVYRAPPELLDEAALRGGSDDDALSGGLTIFKEFLLASPPELGWSEAAPPTWDRPLADIEGGDGVAVDGTLPHFFWECFCCTAPWTVVAALNGVDERLDEEGDDCHERNLSERARLLGFDVRLHSRLVLADIDH
eukprot:SAG11_NODE_13593_length_648_cov_0.755920_1_plen_203_part_01